MACDRARLIRDVGRTRRIDMANPLEVVLDVAASSNLGGLRRTSNPGAPAGQESAPLEVAGTTASIGHATAATNLPVLC